MKLTLHKAVLIMLVRFVPWLFKRYYEEYKYVKREFREKLMTARKVDARTKGIDFAMSVKNYHRASDKSRIDRMLRKIERAWKKTPGLRLSQLLYNMNVVCDEDTFYQEDDISEQKIDKYLKGLRRER